MLSGIHREKVLLSGIRVWPLRGVQAHVKRELQTNPIAQMFPSVDRTRIERPYGISPQLRSATIDAKCRRQRHRFRLEAGRLLQRRRLALAGHRCPRRRRRNRQNPEAGLQEPLQAIRLLLQVSKLKI